MHIHIATMGDSTEPIKKSFQALGFDKLYLISNEKYRKSVEDVTTSLNRFGIESIFKNVSGFDFQEVVNTIFRIYEIEKDNLTEISINITGGTNLMTAAACSCAFFIGATIYYVMHDEKLTVKQQVIPIPVPKTPNLASLKQETKDILRYILERTESDVPVYTSDIMDHFNRTKQSAGYQIRILKNEGLIKNDNQIDLEKRHDHRIKPIELTPQGRMVASWI